MEACYVTFTMTWEGISIEVSHQANWLNSSCWHIELRCGEPLPVTATGYRSIFVPAAEFADTAEVQSFIEGVLADAAQSKQWIKHWEDRKQLQLF